MLFISKEKKRKKKEEKEKEKTWRNATMLVKRLNGFFSFKKENNIKGKHYKNSDILILDYPTFLVQEEIFSISDCFLLFFFPPRKGVFYYFNNFFTNLILIIFKGIHLLIIYFYVFIKVFNLDNIITLFLQINGRNVR